MDTLSMVSEIEVTRQYRYDAKVVRVIDGDSIVIDIDLGYGIWLTDQHVRLYGINTPEIRGEERESGLLAKSIVSALLTPGTAIIIDSFRGRADKYGRWLAKVWYMQACEGNVYHCLNEELVLNGYAVRYMED